jgi:hypothetical protein
MDTIGHPICTGTNASDWGGDTLGKEGKIVPQEHLILLDAASRAAAKLGVNLEVVDVSEFGFFQKRKLKKVIPSIEIGEKIITGLPTSDEIVDEVQPIFK